MANANSSKPVTGWFLTILIGAVICGFMGPAIGSALYAIAGALGQQSVKEAIGVLCLGFLVAYGYALIGVGPGALVFGATGAIVIRLRSRAVHNWRRLTSECIFVGAALGALVGLSSGLWIGIGSFSELFAHSTLNATFIPLGTVCGIACSIVVVRMLRRQRLLSVEA
jgi:hypothetical protein